MRASGNGRRTFPYLTYEGKIYGIPAVINANSMIALEDKVGKVDSYGVDLRPEAEGQDGDGGRLDQQRDLHGDLSEELGERQDRASPAT